MSEMQSRVACEYSIIRYVPFPLTDEAINVGVIAGVNEDWAKILTADFQRAAYLGETTEQVVAEYANNVPRPRSRDEMVREIATRNNVMQLTPLRVILATDPADAIGFVCRSGVVRGPWRGTPPWA